MVKDNGQRKPIWITKKALKKVKKKRKVYAKYKDRKHPAVEKANREASEEVKRAKQNFEDKLAKNIKQDTKSFFAYVRSKKISSVTTDH